MERLLGRLRRRSTKDLERFGEFEWGDTAHTWQKARRFRCYSSRPGTFRSLSNKSFEILIHSLPLPSKSIKRLLPRVRNSGRLSMTFSSRHMTATPIVCTVCTHVCGSKSRFKAYSHSATCHVSIGFAANPFSVLEYTMDCSYIASIRH